jgi:hypothetical protein
MIHRELVDCRQSMKYIRASNSRSLLSNLRGFFYVMGTLRVITVDSKEPWGDDSREGVK